MKYVKIRKNRAIPFTTHGNRILIDSRHIAKIVTKDIMPSKAFNDKLDNMVRAKVFNQVIIEELINVLSNRFRSGIKKEIK